MTINYDSLPHHMQDGMKRYIEDGVPPGSFMYAVLSNDLVSAVGKADHINQNMLPVYAKFLYNEAPRSCWGNPKIVSKWKGTNNN